MRKATNLVRIASSRGYGGGLYEIVKDFAPQGEVLLRPYGWKGEEVRIYRAHTIRPSVEEVLHYVRGGR
jgi:hypothetical protein